MTNEGDMAEVEAAVAKDQEADTFDHYHVHSINEELRGIALGRARAVDRRAFRDACAIAAVQGTNCLSRDSSLEYIARSAFNLADAMLAERDRRDAEEDAKEKRQ